MMTKKHFIKIAEVLGNQNKVDIQLVNELMDLFETFNSNFNRNIFLKKVVDCKKIYISDEIYIGNIFDIVVFSTIIFNKLLINKFKCF